MTTPTVNVTVNLADLIGVAVAGATVKAKLDKPDAYNGTIIPAGHTSGVTDAGGTVVLALFPNALQDAAIPGLGTTGSTYGITITAAGEKTARFVAVVPNQNCTLDSIVIVDSVASQPSNPSNAVRFDLAQSLTSPQQATARANVGFDAAARAVALTGLSTASTADVTAADSVLSGIGKLMAKFNQLATSAGASLVGFINAGTGAVWRSAQDVFRDKVRATDFMTSAQIADIRAKTHLVDVTAAVQAAAATGKAVKLPGGFYKITDGIECATKGQMFYGDGLAATVIYVPATFNLSALGVFFATCGEHGPQFRHMKIAFVQPDTTVRANLVAYPPALYMRSTPRFRVQDVAITNAMTGIDMKGNSGGATIRDVEISSYNVDIDIDGALDTVRTKNIQHWPFDMTANQLTIYEDGNTIGNRIGRCDDLHSVDEVFLMKGKQLHLIAGADGFGSFGRVTNGAFDTHGSIVCSGPHSLKFDGASFSSADADAKFLDQTDGWLVFVNLKAEAAALSSNALFDIHGSNGGGTAARSLTFIGGRFEHQDGQKVINAEAAVGMNWLRLLGNDFVAPPNTSPANPLVRVKAGARVTATGNRLPDKGTGTGNWLTIDADEWHVVQDNSLVGWGLSLPASKTFGSYQGHLGTPTSGNLANCTFPTLNQNTTGSAAKWTTARNLAGNSVDGSANVTFANKFIVQGTADSGLSAAQFLGALATGIVKNTTTTGVLSIAVAADFPTLNQNTTGSAATLTTPRAIYGNNFDGSASLTAIIASTFGGTGNGFTKFTGPATAERTFTLPNASATVLTDNAAVTGAQGGTGVANTGKTITLAGNLATAGAFDLTLTATAITNVTLPTSGTLATVGGNLGTPSAVVLTNATGTASGLTAGNVVTNANLTGPITSVGNATAIASQTGTGTKIVVDTSPTLVTPVLGVATATSITASSGAASASGSFTSSGSLTTILATDTGANGVNLKMTGNGATTPSKFQRVFGGNLEWLNNAYSTVILQLSDGGDGLFAGSIKSISPTGGVGYSTGAGGTVTQATSKSTGVTLNRPSGQITMNAASLAAGASVSFTLTNSAIGASDTVDAHRSSGGTAGAYDVYVDSNAAGSCVIRVKNNTGGALAEAPVINFTVCKGASA